jgi:hypothetical protein
VGGLRLNGSLAFHENVRLLVSEALLEIMEKLLVQKIRIAPTLDAVLLKNFFDSFRGEHILMLMPQEIYVSHSERDRVDAVLGGFVAFDYKSYESEFNDAANKAEQKYLPKLSKVKYYVITNWDKWNIYTIDRVKGVKLREVYVGDRIGALSQLENIIAREVKELKIPPFPKNIEKLFTINIAIIADSLKKVFDYSKNKPEVKPLFESYRKIMKTLYSEASDAEVEGLFMKHTLMHMISMACLSKVFKVNGDSIDLCSGALLSDGAFDISLPYLNWWKIAFHLLDEQLKGEVRKASEEICVRASLLDWELGGEEDVFRRLYEVLVEPETRRRIGEYYTPIWLVDTLMRGFKLRDKFVLDPFCGSGTFLVRSFYKKLAENESPEEAYEELVGLDINPLAVAIARAELLIAYHKSKGKGALNPPHIYHADTLAAWFGGSSLMLEDPDYSGILNDVESYVSDEVSFGLKKQIVQTSPKNLMRSLSNIERALVIGIRLAMIDSIEGLENRLKERILQMLNEKDLMEGIFRRVVERTTFANRLAALIRRYGNGVWATTIVSALVPTIIKEFRPNIIVTNPPWVQVTKYRAQYISKIHDEGGDALKKILSKKGRCASIVTGSDVACMALRKALQIAKEGVGFVMNREQSFYSASSMRAGILLTHAILNEWAQKGQKSKVVVELIDVDYDAFGHGIYPTLIRACRRQMDEHKAYKDVGEVPNI